jgi:type IV secretion system protein VirB9
MKTTFNRAATALAILAITSASWAQTPGNSAPAPTQVAQATPKPLAPGAKATTSTAVAKPLDSRVVVFPFNKDGIFDINTRTNRFTRLEFAQGEQVKAFYISDTIQWETHVSGDKRNILIKPIQPRIATSATVITNKRTYDFDLTEGKGQWMQRVNWTVPFEDPSLQYLQSGFFDQTASASSYPSGSSRQHNLGAPCNGAKLNQNTRYQVEQPGGVRFVPTHIWDDGRYTCIALPEKTAEIPALFALDAEGKTELVDYKFLEGVMIAPRVLDYGAVLKLGRDEVRISYKDSKDGVQ